MPHTLSDCRPHHATILAKLEQGLSAVRIQQDLARDHGSDAPSYRSLRRYVRRLGAGSAVPFRRMECAPGAEAQVDFGRGAPIVTADGKRRRPHVLRVVLIESVQVSKTFTPDQQGDASGGAVNVILKGIPTETIFQFNVQTSYNTQATGNGRFLSYRNGGVSDWGMDGSRTLPRESGLGVIRDPSVVGVSPGEAPPPDYKWSLTAGGKYDLADKWKIGGLGSFFYDKGYTFYDNGKDDSWWIDTQRPPADQEFLPATTKGRPNFTSPETGSFSSKLFDITQSAQTVKWGSLGTVGIENDKNSIALVYLFTQTAEDKTTLAEDTRGKEYFFPGYDANNPTDDGNTVGLFAAPYQRVETLQYTERTTQTIQLKGRHELPWTDKGQENLWLWRAPVVDWALAGSGSRLYQPDKRQFASEWYSFAGGTFLQNKPGNNFNLGQFQEIWKDIHEDSLQQILNITLPFSQWSDSKGYIKTGVFHDTLERTYRQNSYSNLGDFNTFYSAPFDEYWSGVWPTQAHSPIDDGDIDVNYNGLQDILAWYVMADVPLTSYLNLIGGLRREHTELSTHLDAEPDATVLLPLENVSFRQEDMLPAIGLVFHPDKAWTLRLNYSQTVARQTFKELAPIENQEYLGADVFVGNPDLTMSALKNYDVRLDYTPYEGGLVSLSYFFKDIQQPIEYVQEVADLGFPYYYTTARNYPSGTLSGVEVEVRQDMGKFFEDLKGLTLGGNATLMSSKVFLPQGTADDFTAIGYPMSSRDMTNTPEYLYNIYLAYEIAETGTQMGLFYSVRGDTLSAGASAAVNAAGNAVGFIPSIYEKEYDSLNFNLTQSIGKYVKLTFQAKNLTDPVIQRVYRSEYIGGDVVKNSYTKGIDLSLGISVKINF